MAAVFAGESQVLSALSSLDGRGAAIANVNSATQVVVSGASPEVERAIEQLERSGLEVRRLAVSVAWHSSFAAALGESAAGAVFSKLDVRAPCAPLLCNVTGEYFEPGASTGELKARFVSSLVAQFGARMDFPPLLRKLRSDGFGIFVEAGPRGLLTGFANDCDLSQPFVAVAADLPKKEPLRQIREAARAGEWS